jgi:hypothetical protein
MAIASKHKAMSYGRMEESEKRLREEVHQLLKQGRMALAIRIIVMGANGGEVIIRG